MVNFNVPQVVSDLLKSLNPTQSDYMEKDYFIEREAIKEAIGASTDTANTDPDADSTLRSDVKGLIENTTKENPFNTAYGQIVTSIEESFLARKLREGRFRRVGVTSQAINGTLVGKSIRGATADTVFYPNRLFLSSNVACSGYFEIVTGVADADTIRRSYSLPAAGVQAFDLPDGYYVLPTGSVNSYTTATSGTLDFEVQGVEVAYNG